MILTIFDNVDLKGSRLVSCKIYDDNCIVNTKSWSNSTRALYNVLGGQIVESQTLLRKMDYGGSQAHTCQIKGCDKFAISFNGVSPNKFYQELINLSYKNKLRIELKIKLNESTLISLRQDFDGEYAD
jgi:hypothetical protein